MKFKVERSATLPAVTSFKDYRDYLRAVIEIKKLENKKYSYDFWAKKLGTSTSYLKLIVTKKRHSIQDRVWKIAKLFDLTEAEKQYLLVLFQKNTAQEKEVIKYYDDILSSLQDRFRSRDKNQIEYPQVNESAQSAVIYRSWLHMALCSLTQVKDFKEDFEWMHQRLGGAPLTVQKIKEVWAELLQAKLIHRQDGVLRNNPQAVYEADLTDPNNHQACRAVLAKAFDVCIDTSRHRSFAFQNQNIALSFEDGIQMVHIYQDLQKRISELAKNSRDPEYVFLVSNNFFNVTPRAK